MKTFSHPFPGVTKSFVEINEESPQGDCNKAKY